MKRRRWFRKLALSTLLAGAALVLAVKLVFEDGTSIVQSISPSRFDGAVWRAGDLRTRGTLVRDLVDRELLIGTSRKSAVALLGPPDNQSDSELIYRVDLGHRFGSKPWLYTFRLQIDATSGRIVWAGYTD